MKSIYAEIQSLEDILFLMKHATKLFPKEIDDLNVSVDFSHATRRAEGDDQIFMSLITISHLILLPFRSRPQSSFRT